MKIDYMTNPLAILKRFRLLYDDGKRELEGWIQARGEEGLEGVNWFEGQVRYPEHGEIGGIKTDKIYQKLKQGFPTLELAERQMYSWIESMGLEIAEVQEVNLEAGRL